MCVCVCVWLCVLSCVGDFIEVIICICLLTRNSHSLVKLCMACFSCLTIVYTVRIIGCTYVYPYGPPPPPPMLVFV